MGLLEPWVGDGVVAMQEKGNGAWRNVQRLDTAPLPQPQVCSSARMLRFCHPVPRSLQFPAAHRSLQSHCSRAGSKQIQFSVRACLSFSQLSLPRALFPCPAPRKAALALSDGLFWRAFGEKAASLWQLQWLPRRWESAVPGSLEASSRRLEKHLWVFEG